jgi:hypothetical protein
MMEDSRESCLAVVAPFDKWPIWKKKKMKKIIRKMNPLCLKILEEW